jgi:hypothetical protein
VVHAAEQHRGADPQPRGEGGHPGQQLQGLERGDAARDLLDHPGPLEPELLRALHDGANALRVHASVEKRLRDRDTERNPGVHAGLLARRARRRL